MINRVEAAWLVCLGINGVQKLFVGLIDKLSEILKPLK